jgi:uncharacterized protein (TIGR02646 family)
MRFIEKKQPPESLIKAQKENSLYDDLFLETKNEIRESLLEEQGYICCYCMKEIDEHTMKIEHYQSQPDSSHLQLDFKNMLGACTGVIKEKGKTKLTEHCDSAKGSEKLELLDPTESKKLHFIKELKYTKTGKVFSNNPKVQNEIDKILNLNVEYLKRRRASIMAETVNEIIINEKKGKISKSFLTNKIEKTNTKKEGKLFPFCQVIIYRLEQKLKEML